MAKQQGIIKLSGQLDGFVAYQLNGEWVIRRKANISKERYKKDPTYQRMRESSKEFGGASTISKYMRTPWKHLIAKDKDGTFHHRLNAIMLSCIHNGEGERGKRTFSWNHVNEVIQNININNTPPLDHFLTKKPKIDQNNNQLAININGATIQNAPVGSTHFQVIVQLDQVTDFRFDDTTRKYTTGNQPRSQHLVVFNTTEITNELNQSIHLNNLSSNTNWTVIAGIKFFQEINNTQYELAAHPLELLEIRYIL